MQPRLLVELLIRANNRLHFLARKPPALIPVTNITAQIRFRDLKPEITNVPFYTFCDVLHDTLPFADGK